MMNLLILRKTPSKFSEYKKKILTISAWSEDDLKVFEENKIVNWNALSW
jgi:hypothetical protein